MKRLLQYTSHKNNHASFRPLTPHSRAHFTSTHLLPHLLLLSTYFLRASCYALALVSASASRISYLARCFSRALYLWLACIHYMYASYAGVSSGQGSASCFHYRTCFPTVLVHFSSRASWLHALTLYHTLHYCSVPVQRTSRQS